MTGERLSTLAIACRYCPSRSRSADVLYILDNRCGQLLQDVLEKEVMSCGYHASVDVQIFEGRPMVSTFARSSPLSKF